MASDFYTEVRPFWIVPYLEHKAVEQSEAQKTWNALYDRARSLRQLQPSSWVKLINPSTALSSDQAWLLCEWDEAHWLAWLPDHGEILLSTSEFCNLSEP